MIASLNKGCWMCDPKQYRYLTHGDKKVSRVVDEDDDCYVIVPRESHVKHHLLIVLKSTEGKHKQGLIECTRSDITTFGAPISKWCKAFKTMGYDTVYAGCYSDAGHVHLHLIPLNHEKDKGYKGYALQWLAEKEELSAARSFSCLSEQERPSRINEIEKVVAELRRAAGDAIKEREI